MHFRIVLSISKFACWFRKRSNSIMVTRKSVRTFKTCWFFTFTATIFMWCSYPLHLIFWIMIPITKRYNVISKPSLWLSSKNVSISLNSILYLWSFSTNLPTYNFVSTYTFIFCLFSSDTLQLLMFVCPTVSELRFYGYCILVLVCWPPGVGEKDDTCWHQSDRQEENSVGSYSCPEACYY